MIGLNGHGGKFFGWLKGRLLPPDVAFDPGPFKVDDEGEYEPGPMPPSYRFKVTAADGRVYFVYGRDQAQACARLPATILEGATIENAGSSIGIPPEESAAVAASIKYGPHMKKR